MVTQQFFLPMVPDSAPIVINVAQNDFDAQGYDGRLIFNLVADGVAYDMDGAVATFEGGKPDGTAFAYPATIVNASVVRVALKQQMTNVAGRVVCNLVLMNNDGIVGSFNVWLEVQESAIAGTTPSETDIPSLVAQAELAAERAEQAADNAEAWSAHPPYIGANGDWFVYDTQTELYIDTGVVAYGNKWYQGTDVSGKSGTPTAFPTGISHANVNDMYLNTAEPSVYHCTVGGDPTTALWKFDFQITGGGGSSSLAGLSDVGLTTPLSDGEILTYDGTHWVNKEPDKSFVRYGGAKTFSDLVTNAATYLTADYEDVFFLISDGGTIGTGEASQYWSANFSDGDVIPADAHIAVININRGTQNAAVYKYDDFGGFVDISGKADKSALPVVYTQEASTMATSVTFSNIKIRAESTISNIYQNFNMIAGNTYTPEPMGYTGLSVTPSTYDGNGNLRSNGSVTVYLAVDSQGLLSNITFGLEVYI